MEGISQGATDLGWFTEEDATCTQNEVRDNSYQHQECTLVLSHKMYLNNPEHIIMPLEWTDVPMCRNHATDLRWSSSKTKPPFQLVSKVWISNYTPVFNPNSTALQDFIDSLMHISPTP